MTRIVIIGGGPAGYEAALVAAQLGAEVTVVEPDGVGGACVLDDCVPSKTFIASADVRVGAPGDSSGCMPAGARRPSTAAVVNSRVKHLALAQSADVGARLEGRASPSSAAPGSPADGRRAAHGRGRDHGGTRCWTRTSCWSPPARPRACSPTPGRTASGSSPGVRSTTCRSCPSTWSWSVPA